MTVAKTIRQTIRQAIKSKLISARPASSRCLATVVSFGLGARIYFERMETKQRIYDECVKQLNTGNPSGKNFKLTFSGGYYDEHHPLLRIFNGACWRLSDHPQIGDNLTTTGWETIRKEKQKYLDHLEKCRAEEARKQAELEARMDEDGFTLIAGERTEIVSQGTLRECRANLWKVTSYPRYQPVGRGCWIIVDRNNDEVLSGEFDKDCYYY